MKLALGSVEWSGKSNMQKSYSQKSIYRYFSKNISDTKLKVTRS